MNKEVKTVGQKEAFGAGIVAVGLFLFFMPGISQQIADVDFVESSAFTILTGSVFVLSGFIVIAGIALLFTKFNKS